MLTAACRRGVPSWTSLKDRGQAFAAGIREETTVHKGVRQLQSVGSADVQRPLADFRLAVAGEVGQALADQQSVFARRGRLGKVAAVASFHGQFPADENF